ncbi:MAG: hypothetical protein ACI9P5_004594 [Saprospiraceae bacterium]|jgi:hypothetical protein
MKKILIIIFLIAAQSCASQTSNSLSVFHRLLIYNSDNEVLIVKFKDTDIWVTPGFYQDSLLFIKEGLHRSGSGYELMITDPELKGVFSMRKEYAERTAMSICNIYRCNLISSTLKVPVSLGDAQWIPVAEALETVTYKSINHFLKQTNDYPHVVWGGSVNIIRKGAKSEFEIMEKFYPLFEYRKDIE